VPATDSIPIGAARVQGGVASAINESTREGPGGTLGGPSSAIVSPRSSPSPPVPPSALASLPGSGLACSGRSASAWQRHSGRRWPTTACVAQHRSCRPVHLGCFFVAAVCWAGSLRWRSRCRAAYSAPGGGRGAPTPSRRLTGHNFSLGRGEARARAALEREGAHLPGRNRRGQETARHVAWPRIARPAYPTLITTLGRGFTPCAQVETPSGRRALMYSLLLRHRECALSNH